MKPGRGPYAAIAAGDLKLVRPAPVLVQPYHPGTTLAALDADEQRVLFPQMLLSLWDAVEEAPHGDLTARNVILDRKQWQFALIDPGVSIVARTMGDGRREYRHQRAYGRTTLLADPLLCPFDWGAFGVSDPGYDALWNRRSADVMAMGVLYYGILAAAHPVVGRGKPFAVPLPGDRKTDLEPYEPYWFGEHGEHDLRQSAEAFWGQVNLDFYGRDVDPDEAVLCRRLLWPEPLSREELVSLLKVFPPGAPRARSGRRLQRMT